MTRIKQEDAEKFRQEIVALLRANGPMCAYDIAKKMCGDNPLHEDMVRKNIRLGKHLKVLEVRGIVKYKEEPSGFPVEDGKPKNMKKVWRVVK